MFLVRVTGVFGSCVTTVNYFPCVPVCMERKVPIVTGVTGLNRLLYFKTSSNFLLPLIRNRFYCP